MAKMLKNYVYLNPGLTIDFNGEKFFSENGLKDLLEDNMSASDMLYPIIHLKGDDIEVAITHHKPSTARNTQLLSTARTPPRVVHI